MFTGASEIYRRAFKVGMTGWDVGVLQLNLKQLGREVAVDGNFGPLTKQAVVDYQAAHHLDPDGIAGLLTQRSIALVSSNDGQAKYRTPGGLLRGLMEGESGFALAAVTPLYANGSRDIGAYQENLSHAKLVEEDVVAASFNVSKAAENAASRLRSHKDSFRKQSGADTDAKAWQFAVLNHNWQAAAPHFAAGDIDTWEYEAEDRNGVLQKYRMNDPADWIIAIGVSGVRTGYEWATFYIAGKTHYVREYTP